MAAPDAHGFDDPVFDAQHVFRCAMMALAQPGTLHRLNVRLKPPAPLSPGIAALALTLCDFETAIWLDDHLQTNGEVTSFLRFHTGASFVEHRDKATFGLIGAVDHLLDLQGFSIGTLEYPDRSATLVIDVCHLRDNADGLVLSGPGIDGKARLDAGPAVTRLRPFWAENHKLFPRGIDAIFVANDIIAAVPRSTKVTE
jgi:alpha-D-ribose 1-methylphosphonate 5-triphosphate synthase subunit PhnH